MAYQLQELGELLDQFNDVFSADMSDPPDPALHPTPPQPPPPHSPGIIIKKHPIMLQRPAIRLSRRSWHKCCETELFRSPPVPGLAETRWYTETLQ